MLERSADSPIKGRRDLKFSHFSRRYSTKLSDSDVFHMRFNSDAGLSAVSFFDGSLQIISTMLGDQMIKAGDKVLMWYLSGNRDESIFDDADRFLIDRPNARQHLSFGFGIHRCMGNRLAEMQLRVLWEEILNRFSNLELVGDVERVPNNFIRGISNVPVRVS